MSGSLRLLLAVLVLSCTGAGSRARDIPGSSAATLKPDGYIGNQACADCHASMVRSYETTSMARASGPAIDNLIPADFLHQKSEVRFRIYPQDGKVWLAFGRANDPEVQGRRELLYFIGSGRRGRSYLFASDGFLFESPVNWYTDRQVWDMAPAYGEASQIPMTLPASTGCMHCHFSGMKAPERGTENRYPMPPFRSAGVSCETCHGPGAEHAKGGAIVNPAKLDAARRDAICMQCHLEGKAAIEKSGRHIYEFRPGAQLSDYIEYFVYGGAKGSSLGAVSQFEALAQSACKKKSGDAMSCTSCHDPHGEPTAAERADYYREKCLACHAGKLEKAHAKRPDCTSCHMPSSLSADVAHTEVTDHRIARRPQVSPDLLQNAVGAAATQDSLPKLVRFPSGEKSDDDIRNLALAWETVTDRGMSDAAPEAEHRLRAALKKFPDDPVLLSALGFAEQKKGETKPARELYRKALAIDASLIDAASNLGVIEMKLGNTNEAVKLWKDAFRRDPGRSAIGMNLARVLCQAGETDNARDAVLRVLQFNPDLPEGKNLLRDLNRMEPQCAK